MLIAAMAAVSLSAMVIVGQWALSCKDYGLTALGAGYGLGKNVWDISLLTIINDVKMCIQTLFIIQCLHATALTLVKLSIISTYWRLFPTRAVRITLLVLATTITAVAISAIFGTLFQCRPMAGAWDFNLERQCFPVENLLYFSTAFSAFTDVVLCILPLPFFWRLDISRKEKSIVSCLFCLGLFAAAASIVRLTTLGRLRNINATMVAITALNWSVAEVITGIVCACLPCLKPLLNRLVPGRFFTRHTGTDRNSIISPSKIVRPPSYATAHLSTSGSGHWRGRGDSWYEKVPLPKTVSRQEFAKSYQSV